jgi:hypothetical protein
MNDESNLPNSLAPISDFELSIHLKRWFTNRPKDKNVWNRNKVGRVLKEELTRMKHWKGKTRGDPRKGWDMKEESRLRSDGFVFE